MSFARKLAGTHTPATRGERSAWADVLAFPQRDPHDFCSKIYPKFTQEPVFSVHDEYA